MPIRSNLPWFIGVVIGIALAFVLLSLGGCTTDDAAKPDVPMFFTEVKRERPPDECQKKAAHMPKPVRGKDYAGPDSWNYAVKVYDLGNAQVDRFNNCLAYQQKESANE